MTRVRVAMCAVVLLMPGGIARAQDVGQGWQVSIDFLNIVTRGNDVHVGDVFTERQALSGTPLQNRFDYGVEYQPIVTPMDDERTVMLTAVNRGARWGGGARGWRVQTGGEMSGARRSAAPTATSQAVTGIRLWDNSILPVTNTLEASGFSPLTFHAENTLKNTRVEVFAERSWVRGDAVAVSARFGLAHARVENTRAEGQTQRAFVTETEGGVVTTLDNAVTLDAESEATMSLTGPLLGLAGESTAGRFRLEWLISHSVLLGTAETSGSWIDIDDIVEVTTGPGGTIETRTLLNGLIEKTQDDRAVVPVLELQVKGSFRATDFLSVGAGVFSSSWFGLPVAPAFSVPDDWTDVQGTGWRQQSRDITFAGVSVFAAVGF